jgi:hypothetical protein
VWAVLVVQTDDDDTLTMLLTLRQGVSSALYLVLTLALAAFFVALLRIGNSNSAVMVCFLR